MLDRASKMADSMPSHRQTKAATRQRILAGIAKWSTLPAESAAHYPAMTGQPFSTDGVLKTGERIYHLERYYSNLAGFREASDYLPGPFLKEPSTMNGSTGHGCELPRMVDEYYRVRGSVDGVVPESKLNGLEIEYRETTSIA
jgi:aldehyde:ferredoxin oxidoreductase